MDSSRMARHIPPWLAEPVAPTSGIGSIGMRRMCGIGARPWFPNTNSNEGTHLQTAAVVGLPRPLQPPPNAWVRSLSLPPSVQQTAEYGFSTPLHSPRPCSVPTLPLTPRAIPIVPQIRTSSTSLSPRASSTYLGHSRSRGSMPEGPAIPLQRKATNRSSLNAFSCTEMDRRRTMLLGEGELLSRNHWAEPRTGKPGRTSHVLLERNQVPQRIDCKQAETPMSVQNSEYIVYASKTTGESNPPQFLGSSDGSPTNSVWKRYFAEEPVGRHCCGSRKSAGLQEVHGSGEPNGFTSLPATAPNSERGKQEAPKVENCSASFQDFHHVWDRSERTELTPEISAHNSQDRLPESPDSQRGLRGVVGLFGIPVDAQNAPSVFDPEGSQEKSLCDKTNSSVAEPVAARPTSDMTGQESALTQGCAYEPQGAQADELQVHSTQPFVPDAAQVEAIAQSFAKVDAAAQKISLKHLHELRSFRQPPAAICQVVAAALSLFGINTDTWSSGRWRLDSQFLQKLKSFTVLEAARCPAAQVHQFLGHLDAPPFSDQSFDKCPGAAPLAQWCSGAAELLLHLVSDTSKLRHLQLSNPQPAPPAPLAPLGARVEVKTVKARKTSGRTQVRDAHREQCDLGGLFVKPSLWKLNLDELEHVEDLVIGREGVGQITFHGKTDCRGLLENLSQILSIQPGEIIVYPDATLKPDVGQGLNKPASVQLQGCMPKCQMRLTDSRAQQRYKQRVAQMTQEKGAIFEDYDPVDGTWKFRVPHF